MPVFADLMENTDTTGSGGSSTASSTGSNPSVVKENPSTGDNTPASGSDGSQLGVINKWRARKSFFHSNSRYNLATRDFNAEPL